MNFKFVVGHQILTASGFGLLFSNVFKKHLVIIKGSILGGNFFNVARKKCNKIKKFQIF